MEKRKDVVDRLLRSATILFGEKRAEEIRVELEGTGRTAVACFEGRAGVRRRGAGLQV